MKIKLTRTAVEKLQPAAKPADVYDSGLAGFACRVHPSGAKTFVLRYRPKGAGRAVNPRTITFGRHPAMTPEQARDLARAALARVAEGEDPGERKEAVTTIGAVLDRYLDHLAGRPSLRVAKGDVRNHLRPAFGHLVPRELTARRVREFINRLEEAGKERRAGACITTLRAAATRAGMQIPALQADLGLMIWRKRKRVASREELGAVLTACRDLLASGECWPWAIYLLLLLIFSGARPSEIRTARRDEVDLERGLIIRQEHKTRRKTGEAREIELPKAAVEIVRRMPGIVGNPHLIPGKAPGAPLRDYMRPWRKVCERAGVSGLWVYDLRRTYTSLGLGRGFTLDQLGKALGHSHAATTEGYAWLLPTDRRRIAEAIAAEVSALLPELSATPLHPSDDRGTADRP